MIQAEFLGGAANVGASSTLLHFGDNRILVDCGIRMGEGENGRLPDLSPLNDSPPEAVVLTHAHMDHSGALPLLLASLKGVPLYCTPPTAQLIRILFDDALKIMDSKGEEDVPLFTKVMVEDALNRIVEVPFEHPLAICSGSVEMTFLQAGHILGAAMASFRHPKGKVLFTGDFAVSPQRTVGGAAAPRGPFDLLVIESTYGSRFHPDRESEERRLAEAVAKNIRKGGFVLVPAFAVGRAQEILLILSGAMERGEIQEFPVFADGMVTRVCNLYREFPNDVAGSLAKRIKSKPHPFFPPEGPVRAVLSPKDREKVLQGPPAAIISSSGMLSGGPSVWYATELARKAESLISITGYQDEESPGRTLAELAEGTSTDRMLRVPTGRIPVACRISKFGLSAHADGSQIARFVAAARPRNVALVHGDQKSREDLWNFIKSMAPETQVHLPENGGSIRVAARVGKTRREAAPEERSEDTGIGEGRFPRDEADLALLHGHVVSAFPSGRFFTARELFNIFCGPSHFDAEGFEAFRTLLKSTKDLFRPHKDRQFLFKPILKDDPGSARKTEMPGVMEPNAAMATARGMFPPEARLRRVGTRMESSPPALVLNFAFPRKARERFSDEIGRIAQMTGFEVELNMEENQAALAELLQGLLPADIRVLKGSFHREQGRFTAQVGNDSDFQQLRTVAEVFLAESGIILEPTLRDKPPAMEMSRDPGSGRLEINAAFSLISEAFVPFPGTLFRKSRKTLGGEEFLELGFLTPAVGEGFRTIIDRLSFETGWPIRIAATFHQQELGVLARRLVEPHAQVIGNPSIRLPEGVEIKVVSMPDPAKLEAIIGTFREKTGLLLTIRGT